MTQNTGTLPAPVFAPAAAPAVTAAVPRAHRLRTFGARLGLGAAALALAALTAVCAVQWAATVTPGWHTAGTARYYIDAGSRRRVTGLATLDGARYLFDAGGRLVQGWGQWQGKTYYAGADGQLLTGEQTIDGTAYWLDPQSGEFHAGFYTTAEGRRAGSEQGYPLTGLQTVGGQLYCFDEDGLLRTGWLTDADGAPRYYAGADGALATGLQTVDGERYYFEPRSHVLQHGVRRVGDAFYCFDDATGAMLHDGFVERPYGRYYTGADGVCLTGWQELDGGRYYFDHFGCLVADGYHTIDGVRYCFTAEGPVRTGFQALDGALYCFGEDGAIRPGYQEYDGADRLFDADGRLVDGWQTLGGSTYYYILGVRQSGETEIDGTVYNIGADGVFRSGWADIGLDRYYFNWRGYPLTGWQQISKCLYHFNDQGVMDRNTQLDGYYLDAYGVATRTKPAAMTLYECYDYVRKYMNYVHIDPDTPENMLQHALLYHRGACYHYATLLQYVMEQNGYPGTVIWGTNLRTGGIHCWVETPEGLIVDSCNSYFLITYDELLAKGYSP